SKRCHSLENQEDEKVEGEKKKDPGDGGLTEVGEELFHRGNPFAQRGIRVTQKVLLVSSDLSAEASRLGNRIVCFENRKQWLYAARCPCRWGCQLVKNRHLSNNVGGVKYVIGTQLPALGDERHFTLADGLRFPIEGSLAIVAVRNSVRPNHLFDDNLDHDY